MNAALIWFFIFNLTSTSKAVVCTPQQRAKVLGRTLFEERNPYDIALRRQLKQNDHFSLLGSDGQTLIEGYYQGVDSTGAILFSRTPAVAGIPTEVIKLDLSSQPVSKMRSRRPTSEELAKSKASREKQTRGVVSPPTATPVKLITQSEFQKFETQAASELSIRLKAMKGPVDLTASKHIHYPPASVMTAEGRKPCHIVGRSVDEKGRPLFGNPANPGTSKLDGPPLYDYVLKVGQKQPERIPYGEIGTPLRTIGDLDLKVGTPVVIKNANGYYERGNFVRKEGGKIIVKDYAGRELPPISPDNAALLPTPLYP